VRTSIPLRLLVVLPLFAGCGPEPQPLTPSSPEPLSTAASEPPSAPPALFAIVPEPPGAERIAVDIRFLASPDLAGRGTGDPGAKRAADFIAKRFADLKFTPLGDKGPQGQGYFQSFQARVGAKVEGASLSAQAAKDPQKIEVAVANGSADGTATGKAVFVGYGITAPAVGWDDYAGANIEGKIAVVLDGVPKEPTLSPPKNPPVAKADPHAAADPLAGPPASGNPHGGAAAPSQAGANPHGDPHAKAAPGNPLRDFGSTRYKIRTAREHKAAGVVIISSGAELPAAPTDAASMGIPAVVALRAAANPLFTGVGLAQKGVWEAKKPARPKDLATPKELSLTSKIKPLDAESWNVVAMLPARADSKTASEYVVVGAHYDHLGHGGSSSSMAPGVIAVHPGADDNASGAALLLEVARRFRGLPRGPARNMIFIAFGAEELGTIGSHYWVEHPPVPIAKVTAMLNADMVGRLRNNRLLVDGTGTAAAWPTIAKEAAEGLNLNITFGTEGFGASDHTSFTAARIPVTFLFTGVHDDYHRPTDTADKVNVEGEERIATLAGRIALAVAEAPERLAFIDPPADPNRGRGRGFKVSLGTVPDYSYQGKGVHLTGVRPDAPAARAGLQAGDTIVRIGTHEIINMHDYMFALGELEPGRAVELEVERGGKRIPVSLIPAPGR
jgi:hypothetical protein